MSVSPLFTGALTPMHDPLDESKGPAYELPQPSGSVQPGGSLNLPDEHPVPERPLPVILSVSQALWHWTSFCPILLGRSLLDSFPKRFLLKRPALSQPKQYSVTVL